MFGLSRLFSSKYREIEKNHKLFNMSRPIGYYPPDVDEKFYRFTEEISNLTKLLDAKNGEIARLKEEVRHLSEELREINYEIQNIRLPEANPIDEMMVLHKFSQETGKEDAIERTGKTLAKMVASDTSKKIPSTGTSTPGNSESGKSQRIKISAPKNAG